MDVGVVVDDEARFFVICDHALLKDLSTEDLDPNQAHMKFAASFAPTKPKSSQTNAQSLRQLRHPESNTKNYDESLRNCHCFSKIFAILCEYIE